MLGFRRLSRSPTAALAAVLIAAVVAAAAGGGGGWGSRAPGGGGSGADRGSGAPGAGPRAPADASTARVERVVDGDTVRLAGVGPVRLIGVDTPETYGGRTECFGPEASAYVKALLPQDTEVRYTVGEEPRDRYGRLLAYLYMPDGAALNYVLVSAGYARTLTVPPNDRYASAFERAERAARLGRSGMWARPGCADG